MKEINTCDEYARKGTGFGRCSAPVDAYGTCARGRDHVPTQGALAAQRGSEGGTVEFRITVAVADWPTLRAALRETAHTLRHTGEGCPQGIGDLDPDRQRFTRLAHEIYTAVQRVGE